MTDFRINVYEAYLSAWSAISDDERKRLLRESVTEAIPFKNLMKTRNGVGELIEHLEAFQARSPGGSFRFLSMLGWEDNAIAKWQMIDAEGKGDFTGYDVLVFGQDHRIQSILMFVDTEKQRIK